MQQRQGQSTTRQTAGAAGETATVAAVVLAAGKSTRMKSKVPKTLHPVCGRPILVHILETLGEAGVSRRIVVVGHQAEMVQAHLDERFGAGTVGYALQAEQKGTGHAAQMAEAALAGHAGTVLIVPGDTPLLSADVLRALLDEHARAGNAATLLTAVLPRDAGAYGRVLRDPRNNTVQAIVEARDASPEQRAVREINTSVYAFDGPALFAALRDLRPDNAQGELYLTDVIALLARAGQKVGALVSPDPDVVLGVNTRVELAEISTILRSRILRDLMLTGVTVEDPATTFVEAGVRIGLDTTLRPFTILGGETIIGEDCVIGPHAHLLDAVLGDGVRARACFIERAEVGDACRIGPFANLRPGTRLGRAVKIGDFVETKNAILGDHVSASHLTYLGDATVGAATNIGAGTITCNYDGMRKHHTTIGANAFIGSDTVLVAPVHVDAGAITGAGSVITRDVPAGALALARERQINKENWAAQRRTPGTAADSSGQDSSSPCRTPPGEEGTSEP